MADDKASVAQVNLHIKHETTFGLHVVSGSMSVESLKVQDGGAVCGSSEVPPPFLEAAESGFLKLQSGIFTLASGFLTL